MMCQGFSGFYKGDRNMWLKVIKQYLYTDYLYIDLTIPI